MLKTLIMVEIRVRIGQLFLERKFCRLLIAVPLRVWLQYIWPPKIEFGQMLKFVRKWPMTDIISSTVLIYMCNLAFNFEVLYTANGPTKVAYFSS